VQERGQEDAGRRSSAWSRTWRSGRAAADRRRGRSMVRPGRVRPQAATPRAGAARQRSHARRVQQLIRAALGRPNARIGRHSHAEAILYAHSSEFHRPGRPRYRGARDQTRSDHHLRLRCLSGVRSRTVFRTSCPSTVSRHVSAVDLSGSVCMMLPPDDSSTVPNGLNHRPAAVVVIPEFALRCPGPRCRSTADPSGTRSLAYGKPRRHRRRHPRGTMTEKRLSATVRALARAGRPVSRSSGGLGTGSRAPRRSSSVPLLRPAGRTGSPRRGRVR
jgi:hypothetical protein